MKVLVRLEDTLLHDRYSFFSAYFFLKLCYQECNFCPFVPYFLLKKHASIILFIFPMSDTVVGRHMGLVRWAKTSTTTRYKALPAPTDCRHTRHSSSLCLHLHYCSDKIQLKIIAVMINHLL
jgi:hypothetical protein